MLTYRSGLCFKIKRFTDPLDQNWVLAFIRKSYSPLVTEILLTQCINKHMIQHLYKTLLYIESCVPKYEMTPRNDSSDNIV